MSYSKEGIPAGFLARGEAEKPGRVIPGRVAVAAGIFAALLCALVAADYLLNSNEIHRGVSAGEVDLGGMTRSEARAALEDHASEKLNEIALKGAGERAVIPAGEIGLRLDAATTAGRAYAVGREGGVFARLRQRAGAALGLTQIPPAVDYRPDDLRAEVEGVASRLGGGSPASPGAPGSGGGSAVRLAGSGVELVAFREGYEVEVGATVESAERAIRDLSPDAELAGQKTKSGLDASGREEALQRARRAVGEPLVLARGDRRWTLSSERVAGSLRLSDGDLELDRKALGGELSAALGTLEREPVSARLVSGERGGVEVEPAESGQEVQTERLLDEIGAGIFEGRHRYEVPVSTMAPDFTTQEAEAARPNTMLGEFKTSYRVYDEPPRVENLRTASGAVDGTILAPGETFSFNAATAPIQRYEPSAVIVDGKIDTALGGGLCQVASTLYMAANYAGLEVVERSPHYAELPYIRPGFDATVWFGSLDLKLRNNTGGYLLLEESVEEETGEVVSRVYGQPTDREVEMSSRKLSDNGETTRWRSTRKVVEDGSVVENGALNTDTYKPLEPEAPAPTGRGA
ncbi:VanW family protein [Rubrobacter aplysinae]|uniref:VanW family protein n=1 Tax=Rubrobacter aplysinae TaxID=909625 RepID=UPI00128BBFAC|nr:VanW family protein [Rubrobacter aplysinae]